MLKAQYNHIDYDIKIWAGEKLGNHIAIDTETTITPFTETPDLITFQAMDGNCAYYVELSDLDRFFKVNNNNTFIAHNAPFDVDVICRFFEDKNFFHKIISEDRLKDTQLLYKLQHLAVAGWVPFKSSLNLLSEKYFNETLNKEGEERTSFAQFKGMSVNEIDPSYLMYGALDAIATYKVYHVLMSIIKSKGKNELSHNIQIKGGIALNRIYKRGIGFNINAAQEKLKELEIEMDYAATQLCNFGWIRGQKGCQKKYEDIIAEHGISLPKTESGDLSSKSDDLLEYKYIPFIKHYMRFHELEKLSSFIRDLKDERIHPRYNNILNTGRTSCSKPNFQQLPREGGIRELFVAKPGHTFIITDYSAIELATLAQITYKMFGESTMMDRINEGEDLHRYYASVLHNCKPELVTKKQRQEAKAANFGFPGGLGIDTFIQFSRGYGLELTQEEATEMKNAWFTAFPEMKLYMQYREKDDAAITMSGRVRGGASFCARKNTPFQGAAADGAKLALYNLDIFGFNTVGFVHDEIISEVPVDEAVEMCSAQEQIMVDSMKEICVNVKVGVESTISNHYCK